MKIAPILRNDKPSQSQKNQAIIPLERPIKEELVKGEYKSLRLHTDPLDTDSPFYTVNIGYFGSGNPEEYLLFVQDLDKVIVGQNLMSVPKRIATTKHLLKGDALATFNTVIAGKPQTVDGHKAAMQELMKHVFPARASQTQKRWMHRHMRKPASVTTREHVARVVEINSYLAKFPETADGMAPTVLGDNELKDILDHGNPGSWQKQMILQGFDPLKHSMKEFMDFYERIERTEDFLGGNPGPLQVTKKQKTVQFERGGDPHRDRTRERNGDATKKTYYCMYHGCNGTHDTSECKVIKSMAEEKKKGWKKPKEESPKKKYTGKALNALAKKQAKKMIEKAVEKKRKRQEEASSDEEEDLYNFDKLNIDDDEVIHEDITLEDIDALLAEQECSRLTRAICKKLRQKLNKNKKILTNSSLDELLTLYSRLDQGLVAPGTGPSAKKKAKTETKKALAPVLQGVMKIGLGKPTGKRICILVDFGASHTVIDSQLCLKLRMKKSPHSVYTVPGKGKVESTSKCKVYFELPQLSPTLAINQNLVMLKNLSDNYDMILGRDLMRDLGLVVDFAQECIKYQHISVPMEEADREATINFITNIREPELAEEALDRVKQILDAKYAPVEPKTMVEQSPHLTEKQKSELLPILEKHKALFDGTLGKWKGLQHQIEFPTSYCL